jgi:hypothetical protein
MQFQAVFGEERRKPALVHNHQPCADSVCARVDELYVHEFEDFSVLRTASDDLIRARNGISYGPTPEVPVLPSGYRFLNRDERLQADASLDDAVRKWGFPLEKYL